MTLTDLQGTVEYTNRPEGGGKVIVVVSDGRGFWRTGSISQAVSRKHDISAPARSGG